MVHENDPQDVTWESRDIDDYIYGDIQLVASER